MFFFFFLGIFPCFLLNLIICQFPPTSKLSLSHHIPTGEGEGKHMLSQRDVKPTSASFQTALSQGSITL